MGKMKCEQLTEKELAEIKILLVREQRFELAAKIRNYEHWAAKKKSKVKISVMIKMDEPSAEQFIPPGWFATTETKTPSPTGK